MGVRRFLVLVALVVGAAGAAVRSAPAPVQMFPWPGTATAAPGSQISFRGAPAKALGQVVVTGLISGVHTGLVMPHSDGRGASFVPDKPFVGGETVAVVTDRPIAGTQGSQAQFTIATPVNHEPASLPTQRSDAGAATAVHSVPGLQVPLLQVWAASVDRSSGLLMMTDTMGPSGAGPFIADDQGNIVWFKPLPDGISASDLRVQSYRGKPVLTWWEGKIDVGEGFGRHVMADESYHVIANINMANGYQSDLHDFLLQPDGTALMIAYNWISWDLSAAGRPALGPTIDCVIQRIDIQTGLVTFEWHSLDHVGVDESTTPVPGPTQAFDYFHLNSVEAEPGGNLLLSARNVSAVYEINGATGEVNWRLGGKRSDFTLAPGLVFGYQHDARRRSKTVVSIFDNGAGGTTPTEDYSSGRMIKLDFKHKTASSLTRFAHPDRRQATSQGNFQRLPNGNWITGWGDNPTVTEFDARGRVILDLEMQPGNTYRVWRQPWRGTPTTLPDFVAERSGEDVAGYVSWNGDTKTRTWQLLAGWEGSPNMAVIQTAARSGFETVFRVRTNAKTFRVRALDERGRVLGSSLIKAA